MTEERWRSVAIALGAVLVVLVLVAVATSRPSGPAASPTGSGSPAGGSGSPGTSSEASTEPSAPGSEAPSGSASTEPSGSPTIPPSAGLAQITFTDFRLDATSDPDGQPRTFTFKTDGPGKVTAKLTTRSPQGTARFCLKVGNGSPFCRNWTTGTLTGTTNAKNRTTFQVTLIGVGIATPSVDLALTFRAKDPSVTLTNGRFDGTGSDAEGYNGMSGKVKIRSGGTFSIKADWGDTPFNYTYTLVDLTAPSPGGTFTGNGTGIERTDPAAPTHQFGFSLTNDESGVGRMPLTMTVAWK
ncbi:MAG: hypothetical protein QOF11_1549 [Chloroflexota bacterium]|nr:hypothetical protein [Chloroflexota bacterium]